MYNKVEDFLKDDDFIRYVLDAAPENTSVWEEFLRGHAELLEVFEEAKEILLASEDVTDTMSLSDKRELKQRIFTTLEISNIDY